MGVSLGQIYVELKLDSSKYQKELERQKKVALDAVRQIESAQVSSSKREQKTAQDLLNFKKAMNQQQLKEVQNYWEKVDKINDQIKKSNLKTVQGQEKVKFGAIDTQLGDWQKKFEVQKQIAKSYREADVASEYQANQRKIKANEDYWKNIDKINKEITSSRQEVQQKHLKDLNTIIQYERQLADQRNRVEKAAQTQVSASKTAEEKRRYAELTRGIDEARRMYNQSLGPQKTYLQNTMAISKQVLMAAPGFALATLAIQGFYGAIRAVTGVISTGLKANENYKVSVASMSALITTFSKKAQIGDIAGAFKEALPYSEALIQRLEVLDAKTIATGEELKTLSETLLQGGVLMKINNKEQEEGFLAIASAIKILTSGQNQDVQLRQEARALLDGQVKDTNRLLVLLSKIDPEIKKHRDKWLESKTFLEEMGKQLSGFLPAIDYLQSSWSNVGSTLETIYRQVLRGGFKPMYEDIIEMTKQLNSYFIDEEGHLTKNAKILQNTIKQSWGVIETIVGSIASVMKEALNPQIKFFATAIGMALQGLSYIVIALDEIVQSMKELKTLFNPIAKISSGETKGFLSSLKEYIAAYSDVNVNSLGFLNRSPEQDKRLEAAKSNFGASSLNWFEMLSAQNPEEIITTGKKGDLGSRIENRWEEFNAKYGFNGFSNDLKIPDMPDLFGGNQGKIDKDMLKGYKEMFKWISETREKWADLNISLLPSHEKQVAEIKKKYLDLNDIIFEALATGIVSPEEAELTQNKLFSEMEGAIKALGYDELLSSTKEWRDNWSEVTNILLPEHEQKIQDIKNKYEDLNDKIFEGLALGTLSPEEAEKRQTNLFSGRDNEIRDLNNERLNETHKALQDINKQYQEMFALDSERESQINSITDKYEEQREVFLKYLEDGRISLEQMISVWDMLDKMQQRELTNSNRHVQQMENIWQDFFENILEGWENVRQTVSNILKYIASEIIKMSIAKPLAEKTGDWISKAIGIVVTAAGGSQTAGTNNSIVPKQQSLTTNSNNNQPQQVVFEYKPTIQAIDSRSGIEFLGKHGEEIAGIVHSKFNKLGLRGIER